MRKFIPIFFVLSLLFFDVNASTISYTGQWVHTKYPSIRLEILENGATTTVTEFKEKSHQKFPAKVIDNSLDLFFGKLAFCAFAKKPRTKKQKGKNLTIRVLFEVVHKEIIKK